MSHGPSWGRSSPSKPIRVAFRTSARVGISCCGSAAIGRLWAVARFARSRKLLAVSCGGSAPRNHFGWRCAEVGWVLLPEYQGKGLAQEGAVTAMDFAFHQLGEPRVIHTIRPANTASQKLAAWLGSNNLGPIVLPPPFDSIPSDEWSQTHAEWVVSRKRFKSDA